MARAVRREAAAAFLRQAEEFLASARDNFAARRFNAAGFDAVQALVNANDALTAHFLGTRASMDHREASRSRCGGGRERCGPGDNTRRTAR